MRKVRWRGGGLKYISLIATVFLMSTCLTKAHAANSYIPELTVRQNGSSPEIEIGIEVANPVKYWGNSNNVSPNLRWAGIGGQSITNKDGYTAIHSPDTATNNTGNFYSYPSTSSSHNYMDFGKFYSQNGKWFSMSAKVKATDSRGYIKLFGACGHANRGFPFTDQNGNTIKFRDNYSPSTKGNIRVYTDSGNVKLNNGGTYILVSSHDTNWGYYYAYYKWDQNAQTFRFDMGWHAGDAYGNTRRTAPRHDTFSAGEPVLRQSGAPGGLTFGSRTFNNDGQWHTITLNAKVDYEEAYYNSELCGFAPSINWQVYGDAWATDIKFGEASRVQVFKDSTNYTNLVYDDYGSEFVDTSTIVKPNSPSLTQAVTYSDKIRFNYSAAVKNEQHYYTSRSYNSNGWSALSSPRYVTLNSTPQKYYAKLYKNGTLIQDGYTSTTWEYRDVKRGDRITGGLYTIDSKGQWSQATAVDYTVGQTAVDLQNDISSFLSSLPDSNESVDLVSRNSINSLRTNVNIPFRINSLENVKATKYINGFVNSSTSVNESDYSVSKQITARPIYQTKDEFKSDVIDYINNESMLEYVRYTDLENLKESVEGTLNTECKDNPSLNDVEVDVNANTATEFSEGNAQIDVYYKKD